MGHGVWILQGSRLHQCLAKRSGQFQRIQSQGRRLQDQTAGPCEVPQRDRCDTALRDRQETFLLSQDRIEAMEPVQSGVEKAY